MKKNLLLFLLCFLIKESKAQIADSSNNQPQPIYRMSNLKTGPAFILLDSNEMNEAQKINMDANVESNLKKSGLPKSVPKQNNQVQNPASEKINRVSPNKKMN